MFGWGKILGADLNEPKTREEATLLALLSCADRLNEVVTVINTIQDRLHRLETYVEENVPGYTLTSAYRATRTQHDPEFIRAIQVSASRGNHGGG
jgi:5'(3')-deoxyribonucleotidase